MSTTFHVPRNGVSTTVGASGRTAGAGTLVVATGTGSQFGSVFPLVITVTRSGAVLCVLEVTARSTDTLTISGAIEGTSDTTNMVSTDVVEMRPTALAATELQDAIHNLEAVPEVSVTGTTTLTTSAIGTMQVVSGSSTFALTFPTAVGNAGATIGVRCDSGYTGLVTLTGNSGQIFAGIAGLVMYKNESAVWKSDGSNWVRVGGAGPIAMVCALHLSTPQPVADSTVTKVLLDDPDVDNSGLMADLANNRITAARAGTYRLVMKVVWSSVTAAGVRYVGQVALNGSATAATAEVPIYAAGSYATNVDTRLFSLAAGDHLELNAYQNSGSTQNVHGSTDAACTLEIEEIPSW